MFFDLLEACLIGDLIFLPHFDHQVLKILNLG